ncbi:kinase-like protein [Annulohypoxylon bovei var. microspora]|nr:kinase-like protein [Annulohypoxylon bovei var. microspora]
MGLESIEIDPFQHVETEPLGRGNSEVWKVQHEHDRNLYARKEFKGSREDDEDLKRKIRKEIDIIVKSQHHHVVEFCGSHHITSTNLFGILLRPIADMSLEQFFVRFVGLGNEEPKRQEVCRTMCQWPACLFHALGCLHDAGIRHKDIKPSNILIKDDRVFLTDFGISRDFRDSTTSKTQDPKVANTPPPEIDNDQPRGRAADVWSLGCTVLEICTLATGQNSIVNLNEHLHQAYGGSRPSFCQSPYLVLDWIMLLLGAPGQDSIIGPNIQKMLQLTFLMLDPNPRRRITARQLVDMLVQQGSKYFNPIKHLACGKCQHTFSVPSHNMPLHSVFKEEDGGGIYLPSTTLLSAETRDLWEEVKRRWLKSRQPQVVD